MKDWVTFESVCVRACVRACVCVRFRIRRINDTIMELQGRLRFTNKLQKWYSWVSYLFLGCLLKVNNTTVSVSLLLSSKYSQADDALQTYSDLIYTSNIYLDNFQSCIQTNVACSNHTPVAGLFVWIPINCCIGFYVLILRGMHVKWYKMNIRKVIANRKEPKSNKYSLYTTENSWIPW